MEDFNQLQRLINFRKSIIKKSDNHLKNFLKRDLCEDCVFLSLQDRKTLGLLQVDGAPGGAGCVHSLRSGVIPLQRRRDMNAPAPGGGAHIPGIICMQKM